MDKLRRKLQDFMAGRYGMDQLGRFTMYVSIIALLISLFAGNNWFYLIALVLLITTYARMFSKNHSSRYAENNKYLEWKEKFFSFFRGGARQAKDKDHRYFRCPNCNQKVRVPKGKGTISIRCPKCQHEFIKRT
ncbi:zinc-ribbon domain-containing protein [Novisyntrophococcus fermenticellae]|uniref:zinc-ribbon domain-containing protein n=1 Tax=Novisyntrophococcus fermenticellae TaxID=2068655 RepID=UPI001E5BC8F2|nr:zinc-ribbon domain-containing protein [Novisyntrophococcus fermenticellae]